MRRRPLVWLAILVAGATACRSGTIVEDRWPSYPVTGRVLGPDGAPVGGARVVVRSLHGPCTGASSGSAPVTTGADGRYRAAFGDVVAVFEGCVDVAATPPAGSGLAPATVRVGGLRLDHARGDSAAVDVRLARAD